MKKQWLIVIMLYGCTAVSKLDTIEDIIYEKNEAYVDIEESEIIEKLSIQSNDYQKKCTLKSLLLINQKEVYIFEGASNRLKANLDRYCEQGKRKDVEDFSICIMNEEDDLMLRIVNHLNTK